MAEELRMKGYRFPVEWLALNDDMQDVAENIVCEEEGDTGSFPISLCLVADLFEKPTVEVAKAVVRFMKRAKK